MSVRITYPLDELQLNELVTAGWTSLTLWVADRPDGVYTNTGVTPQPATLAAMQSSATYEAVFEATSQNPAQWFRVRAYNGSTYTPLSDAAPFHGGGGTTLAVLRAALGKRLRDYVAATTTAAGTTTTAICTSFDVVRYPDNYFNNWFWRNTATGEMSQVTGFTKGTGTLTLSPAVAAVGSGVGFELTKRWTPDEYRDALNWAIKSSYPTLSRTVISTSILTKDNVYQYQIPQDIRMLGRVEVESTTAGTSQATRGHPWSDVPYTIVRDGLVQKIELKRELAAGRRLRLTGTGQLSQLYNDSDYVEIGPPQTDLLVYLAAHYLWKLLPNDAAATDIDRAEQLADYYMALYLKDRDTGAVPRTPKHYWAHDQLWANTSAAPEGW